MGNPVRLRVQAHVDTPESGPLEMADVTVRYALTAALGKGDRRQYSVATATFQALTVPTGAKYCLIEIPALAESVFLKAATGDSTGIALTSATAANVPKTYALVPVGGTSPAIGLLNSGASTQVFTATFL
jgi:hypothetical protein